MLKRWPGGLAAVVVIAVTLGLVSLDLTDEAVRRWWAERALTTGTVTGLLVLLVTVLVVDQVLNLRQDEDRSRATAAQAAIVPRHFLEEAQRLGAELARALAVTARTPAESATSGPRLGAPSSSPVSGKSLRQAR